MPNLPVRDRADAKLVGVCAALARTWAIDPLVVRVAFVVVALLTNGFAVAVYLVLWAILPERGGIAPLHRAFPATRAWSWGALAAAALLTTAVAAAVTGTGPGAFVILALAWIIIRFGFAGRTTHRSAPPATPRPAPTTPFERAAHAWQQRIDNLEAGRPADWAPALDPDPAHLYGTTSPWDTLAPAPNPRRRRGFRTWVGILAALAAGGTALAVASVLGVPMNPLAWSSTALLVLGAALLRSTRPSPTAWGRPVLLLPVTILVALTTVGLLASTQAVPRPVGAVDAETRLVAGDVTHLPLGEHAIDLTDRAVTDETLRYELGVGDLTLIVPAEGNVTVRAHARVGEVTLPDGIRGEGFDVKNEWSRGTDPASPTLVVDLSVGVGEITVRS